MSTLPENQRQWLIDDSSLTQRVKDHCHHNQLGDFSVKVVSQGISAPSNDELERLSLASHEQAMIREVLLFCGNHPVIFARTVIPDSTLTGSQRQLANLGNKPLGEFLFSQPDLSRDAMEIAELKKNQQLFDHSLFYLSTINTPLTVQQLWARRSVFRLAKKPLLVAEVFLPQLFS